MVRYFIIIVVLISINSCKKKAFHQKERSFYLGVTPWPPDFTDEGVQLAYNFINTKCDMIVNHFDEGVPWQECLDGTTWPEEITKNINERLTHNQGKLVFLSLAPLDPSRKKKAAYWNKNVNNDVKNFWLNKSLDDSLVSNAYFNFCSRLINAFQPKYLNYAVECNSKDWAEEDFDKFLIFLNRVYTKLKQANPNLPIFTSYVVGLEDKYVNYATKINPYSDYVALSTYPYFAVGSASYGSTEPENIPKNWYSRFKDIAPSKPFAIAETGYIAEDLFLPEFGITKKGNPKWQADYLQGLFEVCNNYNAEFINYFCAYDYDKGYNTLQALGLASPYFKIWKDIGFYDGNNVERLSLSVWNKWHRADRIH